MSVSLTIFNFDDFIFEQFCLQLVAENDISWLLA